MAHTATEAPGRTPGPNLTLLVGALEPLEEILAGAKGDQLVEAGVAVFATLDAALRPHVAKVAPAELRAESRLPELIVRAAVRECFRSTELYARRLKFWASGGEPLGICMGPVGVEYDDGEWVLAPSAGLGCGRVFVQAGNRMPFPEWCPDCNAGGHAPQRAKATLARWAVAREHHRQSRDEAWARELWRLTRLHERRERKVSVLG